MSKVSAISAILQPFSFGSNAERDDGGRYREGKTAKDKARGHIAYKKNRRIWDDGGKSSGGKWVKV